LETLTRLGKRNTNESVVANATATSDLDGLAPGRGGVDRRLDGEEARDGLETSVDNSENGADDNVDEAQKLKVVLALDGGGKGRGREDEEEVPPEQHTERGKERE
jgi:hypothetical protein